MIKVFLHPPPALEGKKSVRLAETISKIVCFVNTKKGYMEIIQFDAFDLDPLFQYFKMYQAI